MHFKACRAGSILPCVSSHAFLENTGCLARSCVVDHHLWAPLKGSKSVSPGDKNLTLTRVSFKAHVRFVPNAHKSQPAKMQTQHILAEIAVACVSNLWHWRVSDCLVSKTDLSFYGQKMTITRICKSYLYSKDLLRSRCSLASCSAWQIWPFLTLRGLPLCETHVDVWSYTAWWSGLFPRMSCLPVKCPWG